MIARWSIVVLALAACGKPPPAPPPAGEKVREARVAIEWLEWEEETPLVDADDGAITYVGYGAQTRVDWASETITEVPAADVKPPTRGTAEHGDEVAFVYTEEQRIDVLGLADGKLRRRIRLDRSLLGIADRIGFDGEVVWGYRYAPPVEAHGDHMLGVRISARPATCDYEVWDTRHDRGRPIRTGETMEAPAREWLHDCTAHALVPLSDGGVQLLVIPENGVLESIWYDGPP